MCLCQREVDREMQARQPRARVPAPLPDPHPVGPAWFRPARVDQCPLFIALGVPRFPRQPGRHRHLGSVHGLHARRQVPHAARPQAPPSARPGSPRRAQGQHQRLHRRALPAAPHRVLALSRHRIRPTPGVPPAQSSPVHLLLPAA